MVSKPDPGTLKIGSRGRSEMESQESSITVVDAAGTACRALRESKVGSSDSSESVKQIWMGMRAG